MNFNHPLLGKNKFVTYGAFGLLCALSAFCYYKTIDIGKGEGIDELMDEIVRMVEENGDARLRLHNKRTDATYIINCSLE